MTSINAPLNVEEVEEAIVEQPTASLTQRAVRSSGWVFGGFVFQNVFRFFSNLILAYLLTGPEVFGIMALVNMVMTMLQMFSDLGIGPNIIQSKRGDEPVFLNTAWSVQVMRGLCLWLIACSLAYPLSLFFDEAVLSIVLPVVGLNAVIMGFNSTRLFSLNRKLMIGRVTLLRSTAQIVGMTAMVGFAYFISPTVWALVVNGLVANIVTMAGSHIFIPGERNRLQIDRAALREILRFGVWIFFSTFITFWAGQVQLPMLQLMLGTTLLGVYWIAFNLAELGPMLVKQLGNMVGFPALAEIYRRDRERFLHHLQRVRLMLILPINLLLVLMIFFGPPFVLLVYPSQYANAAWMLTCMVTGSLAGMVNSTYGNAFFAIGSTWRIMVGVAAQLVILVTCCTLGWYYMDAFGFMFGLTATQWLLYPVYARLAITCGLWQPKVDLPILFGFGILPGAWIIIEKVLF
ncbi:MAG: oligosaccharide flippase family protein [Phycisphaeraceae bacterium]|nr:oligosaccharide flippase family protein [Phycisphaeraceae bacterium]